MSGYYCIRYDFLEFTGNERLDLINRLSTNALNSLNEHKAARTILTNDKGRFVDFVTLLNFRNSVLCMCSFNNSANLTAHLDRYTITDDFHRRNVSGSYNSVLITGKDAEIIVSGIFSIDTVSMEDDDFVVTGENEIILRNDNSIGGYIVIYNTDSGDRFINKLAEADIKKISDTEFEAIRIEHGIPSFNREMTELTNPLECGMKKYISFTKGCYIGQEVIARLDSYDKISKHMIGIRLVTHVPIDERSEIKILKDSVACGYMTSTAISEKFGSIGLGFIKTQYIDYAGDYHIYLGDQNINCKICKLPFTENNL